MPAIPKTLRKLREAQFFLGHMRMESAPSTQPDREHFEFYLSAFLSAARSVTGFFEKKNQLKRKAWWSQWKAGIPVADRQLLNQMIKQRDNEVHEKGADVLHHMEDVPLSKIETPSGLHAAYIASFGEPWGEVQVGVKVYYFTLGGKEVNVIETCQRYVGLLERTVEEFSKV
jgi:hypothetical protein